jgi:hypothetical protein
MPRRRSPRVATFPDVTLSLSKGERSRQKGRGTLCRACLFDFNRIIVILTPQCPPGSPRITYSPNVTLSLSKGAVGAVVWRERLLGLHAALPGWDILCRRHVARRHPRRGALARCRSKILCLRPPAGDARVFGSLPDALEAIFVEKRLKGWSRAKKEALIRGDWDAIRSLSRSFALRRHPEPVEGSG